MPRVLDGRVGLYNRAGLLSRVGVLINTCKQCQKWWLAQVVHSLLGSLGGDWGQEIL